MVKIIENYRLILRMKIIIVIAFFTIGYNSLNAQTCDCPAVLKYVEQQVEDNVASYQHQVVQYKREKLYTAHKNKINSIAAKITDQKACLGLLSRYLFFLRDEHLFIQYNDGYFPPAKDTARILNFWAKEEQLVPNKIILNKKLQGVWFFQDGSYSIDITANKSVNRDFAGIMQSTITPYWQKGNVRIELIQKTPTSFDCIYWRSTRQPKTFHATLTDSTLQIGKSFTFYRKKENAVKKNAGLKNQLYFTKISEQTNYLRIPSFELAYAPQIDSLMLVHKEDILKLPNLIIDVRNNGGGGDRSYRALLPFLFDKTTIPSPISASIWVSKENFRWYDTTKYDYASTQADSIDEQAYVDKMAPYKGKFVPATFFEDTLPTVYGAPKKIAVITNRWCGSTTEGFTLLAKESKKVTQYGEHTGGMVSYGDWRKLPVQGLPVWITMTTKRMVFFNGADIESIGVAPQISLNPEREDEWIKIVQQAVEK
jgi:Peptidase family S41